LTFFCFFGAAGSASPLPLPSPVPLPSSVPPLPPLPSLPLPPSPSPAADPASLLLVAFALGEDAPVPSPTLLFGRPWGSDPRGDIWK
jgi:hypothetical protein